MIRLALLLIFLAGPAWAVETLPGPIPAEVIRVIDGDTIEVEARIWLGRTVVVKVRMDGIDTPELGGKAKCERERHLAAKARNKLERLILDRGGEVELRKVRWGKFGGRILARTGLEGELIAAGLAREYKGGTREGWCSG